MKKFLAFFVPPLLIATAIFFAFQYLVLLPAEKGALQVTASPDSQVFLNGKYVGQTPLCKCPNPSATGKDSMKDLLQAGDYSIKIVPSDKSLPEYTDSITIRKSLLTVVERRFAKNAASDGSIISLIPLSDKKGSELLVVTFPDKTELFVDDMVAGTSPKLIKDMAAGKHELRIRKDGYKDKIVPLLSTPGYQIKAVVYLGVDDKAETPTPTPTPTAPAGTPTVTILETPTGFLRVREDASVGAEEISRANPGDKYPLVDELEGWYKIHLPDGKEGWVSTQYASKE